MFILLNDLFLVSSNVILTAAHCIQDKGEHEQRRPEHAYVVVGKHDLKSQHERSFRVASIKKFIVHSSWKPYRHKYDADIALIILQNQLDFNERIKPICLPSQTVELSSLIGKSGTVAGWGTNEENDPIADVPSIMEIPIISEDDCVNSNFHYEIVMSHRTFCTAGNMGRGPCKGDSGSGLAVKENDVWVIYGIVSATLAGSCNGQSNVVYTSVAQFSDWIREIIQEV
jgi:secreted trypsin-like serine protease